MLIKRDSSFLTLQCFKLNNRYKFGKMTIMHAHLLTSCDLVCKCHTKISYFHTLNVVLNWNVKNIPIPLLLSLIMLKPLIDNANLMNVKIDTFQENKNKTAETEN